MGEFKKFLADLQKRLKSKTFWVSLSSLIVILLKMSGYDDLAAKIPDWLNAILTFGVMIGLWKTYGGDE